MISDVLFEAIEEIERYQSNFPDHYNEIRDEIDKVKGAMCRLQLSLDAPPIVSEQ